MARPLLSSLLLLLACASALPAKKAAEAPPPRKVVASSVAVLLEHRSELGLDLDQARSLAAIDKDFNEKVRGGPVPQGDPSAEKASNQPGGDGGRGGLSRDGLPGKGGGRLGPKGPSQKRPARGLDAEKVWEEDDDSSFARAMEVLRPEQREPARRIAEAYREALYDEREAQRTPPKEQ